MTEQETRQMLAGAILRGEAVCYGFRFELKPDGTSIDPMDGYGPGHVNTNQFLGNDLGSFFIGGAYRDGPDHESDNPQGAWCCDAHRDESNARRAARRDGEACR